MGRRERIGHRPEWHWPWALLGLGAWACLLGCSAPARAQDAGPARALNISTSLDTQLSFTELRRGPGVSESDVVGLLRPAFRIDSRSGRIVGSLAYAATLQRHSKEYDGQNVQNQLNGTLSAELLERLAYVDVSANVSQQAASAYGQQSTADSTVDNPNRIEVGTLSISPYVRGVLGSAVNYELRATAAGTNGRRSIAADSTSLGSSLALSSAFPGRLIGWGLTATHQTLDYRAGRETTNDRVSGSVSFYPDPDLSFNLTGGQESNDIANLDKRRYDNWGGGLTWRPSPRTRAQFQVDQRYFGRGYQVVLEYRLPSTAIQFTSSRDADSGSGATSSQPITIYQALDRLLAAQYPDPIDRDQHILALLGGADPGQLVNGGSINAAVSVVQRTALLASYGGPRLSTSLQLYTTSTRIVDAVAAANGSSQWGYLASVSYRLTPTASLSASGSRLLTRATDTQAGTNLKSAVLGWNDQIARRTTASLNLRYSVFNSLTGGYREGAITATLSQRF